MRDRRVVAGLVALLVAGVVAWFAWPTGSGSGGSNDRDPTAAQNDPGSAGGGTSFRDPEVAHRTVGDAGVLATARASGPGEGPESAARPSPRAPMPVVESRQERSMSSAEKAVQTARMIERLDERATRTEEQVGAARARGDAQEASRQSVVLSRLRQRVADLRQRETDLVAAAQTEDPADLVPYGEDDHDTREAHPHDHEPSEP